jgi:hypothetical protein
MPDRKSPGVLVTSRYGNYDVEFNKYFEQEEYEYMQKHDSSPPEIIEMIYNRNKLGYFVK